MALVKNQTQNTLAQDYQACRAIMFKASKNYSFANLIMPPGKRPHVEALYAVLRVGDDRVDVDHAGFASPQAAIEDWWWHYQQVFVVGDSPYPVLRAYLHTCQQFDIPVAILDPYFRAMIDDLTITRYPTFDDLLYYMEGSAMPVGRAMTHILGSTATHIPDVYPEADALSIGMQLSNFWRDIGQDWGIGRVYIPQEDMVRFRYAEHELARGCVNPAFIALLNFEFERTRDYYRQARQGVKQLASGQWSVMSALEIYQAIMDSIIRNGYDVFTRRATTTKWQKLGLVAKAWRGTFLMG